MAVVHKSEIKDRLLLAVENPKSLVITPLLHENEALGDLSDPDAIDLRLGTSFLLPQVPPQAFFVPSRSFVKTSHVRIHVPLGRYLVVPAHQTVLGSTLEFIKLPEDFSGQILTKSSVARTFMVIETAPWIHPSYRGCLTLEIANVSNTPILVYPGRSIGQLILMHLGPGETKSRKLSGTYLAPVYPEAPTFNDPNQDLEKIGVLPEEFRVPGDDWPRLMPENIGKPKRRKRKQLNARKTAVTKLVRRRDKARPHA